MGPIRGWKNLDFVSEPDWLLIFLNDSPNIPLHLLLSHVLDLLFKFYGFTRPTNQFDLRVLASKICRVWRAKGIFAEKGNIWDRNWRQ